VGGSQSGVIRTAGGDVDGTWHGFAILRSSARALDRTAAGALSVDHAHGPGAAVAYSIYNSVPFSRFPPTYPIKYANWVALGWIGLGLVLTAVLYARYPDRLRDMEHVYVEDETFIPTPA
jgi:hypothetical protein